MPLAIASFVLEIVTEVEAILEIGQYYENAPELFNYDRIILEHSFHFCLSLKKEIVLIKLVYFCFIFC